MNRLDQLYVDKLDGKVSESFWLDKSRVWDAEQARLVSQIQAHQVADHRYYDDGLQLLELASKAHELYSKQPSEQKKQISANFTIELHSARRNPASYLQKTVRHTSVGSNSAWHQATIKTLAISTT